MVQKKCVICGNGGLLNYVEQVSKKENSLLILGIIDALEKINDTFAKILPETVDYVILAVSWHVTEQWVSCLKKCIKVRIYRVPVYVMQYQLPVWDNGELSEQNLCRISGSGTDLLYLETHVADTCNLKCRGCMHFSNIAVYPDFPDIDQFEEDFNRLSVLFSNIYIIRLLGGEPLLNEQLYRYIEVVRKYFPVAELRITTNGLLIPYQGQVLWETVRKCHVSMDISPYPPTIQSIDKIKDILDREHVPYGTIAETLHKFRKSLTLAPTNDPAKSTILCQSRHCHFLKNGKIAKCPLPIMIGDFNRRYGCNIVSEDVFDIYKETSGEQLKEKLERYADMCKYCPDEAAFIDWERTKHDARMEDWVV